MTPSLQQLQQVSAQEDFAEDSPGSSVCTPKHVRWPHVLPNSESRGKGTRDRHRVTLEMQGMRELAKLWVILVAKGTNLGP